MLQTLARRIRRTDRPGFDNTRRNVPAMGAASGWETLALEPNGTTRRVAVGTFGDCAASAEARTAHPSRGMTRFVVVLAEGAGR